jgi:heptosyltransferase-2
MNNAAIINELNLFVTNDTGVMHIASGLTVALIALFGDTNAFEWGPLGENKISIQSPNRKMNGISVDSVFKTCIKILKNQP